MAQVASDLEDLREKRAVRVFLYEQKELVLRQRMNKLDQRWIMRCGERKAHEYTEAMEKVQGKQKLIPSRVIRQQADLCKAFHQLEVLEQDVDHIKDRHRETIRVLHQQIKEMNEQKDELELTYLNKEDLATRFTLLHREEGEVARCHISYRDGYIEMADCSQTITQGSGLAESPLVLASLLHRRKLPYRMS